MYEKATWAFVAIFCQPQASINFEALFCDCGANIVKKTILKDF